MFKSIKVMISQNSTQQTKFLKILIFLICLLVVFGVGGYIISQNSKLPERINGEINLEKEKIYWEKHINTIGAQKAYIEFAASLQGLSANQQHSSAHSFGGALYNTGGDVFSVCSSQFAYGCLHDFLSNMIAEEGLSAAAGLSESCLKSSKKEQPFCQHGIGHGLVASLGYELDDLKRALSFCSDHLPSGKMNGCYSGVFMEYNLRTILGDSGTVREFSGNLNEPCDALEAPYQIACTLRLSQWWFQLFFHSDATQENFSDLGGYCREAATDQDVEDVCFAGIGNYAAIKGNFDTTNIEFLCKAAAYSSRAEFFCTSFAARRIQIEKVGEGLYDGNKCSSFQGVVLKSCLNWVDTPS